MVGIRRALILSGAILIVLGLLFSIVLANLSVNVGRSEALNIPAGEALVILEARFPGHAQSLNGTLHVETRGEFGFHIEPQASVDSYRASGTFTGENYLSKSGNQSSLNGTSFWINLTGKGNAYFVLTRIAAPGQITAEVQYQVTGTNPWYLYFGIVALLLGVALYVIGKFLVGRDKNENPSQVGAREEK